MEASIKSEGPRLLAGFTQWVLLGLSAAIALILLAMLVPLSMMAYLAITADRIPQSFEILGLVGIITILSLILAFLLVLRKIVSTAGSAPFGIENAQRLQRLGWIALAWQVTVLAFAIAGHQINIVKQPDIHISIVDAHSYSASGAVMVLALFILAHVFRKGAEMREELEGTV